MSLKPVIGMVLGDATGIGPELIAKLCASKAYEGKCRPIIIGDQRILKHGMGIAKVDFPINVIEKIEDAQFGEAVDVLNIEVLDPSEYEMGVVNPISGKKTVDLQLYGVDLCVEKKIDGLLYAASSP